MGESVPQLMTVYQIDTGLSTPPFTKLQHTGIGQPRFSGDPQPWQYSIGMLIPYADVSVKSHYGFSPDRKHSLPPSLSKPLRIL